MGALLRPVVFAQTLRPLAKQHSYVNAQCSGFKSHSSLSLVETATAPCFNASNTSALLQTKPDITIGGKALRSFSDKCASIGAGISCIRFGSLCSTALTLLGQVERSVTNTFCIVTRPARLPLWIVATRVE